MARLIFSLSAFLDGCVKGPDGRFDVGAVPRLKVSAASDVSISGPDLAAQALRAGLVDECCVSLAPVVVGGGNRMFAEGLDVRTRPAEEHRFAHGTVFLR